MGSVSLAGDTDDLDERSSRPRDDAAEVSAPCARILGRAGDSRRTEWYPSGPLGSHARGRICVAANGAAVTGALRSVFLAGVL